MDKLNSVFNHEGVSYFTTIPMSWRPADEPTSSEITTWMYSDAMLLRALATMEAVQNEGDSEMGSSVGKILERLEFKIDLTLNLVAQLLAQNSMLPPAHPLFLSASGIEWVGANMPSLNDNIVIAAYISPKLPQPLTLPAKITVIQQEEGGIRAFATFTHLNEEAQDWLSRTVFRYHRRAIQTRHQG